jgi:hypothetical protein
MSNHCFILSMVFVVSIWISVSSIYYSIVYIQQALITNYFIIYLLFYSRHSAGADNRLIWTYGIPNCTIVTLNYYYSGQSDRTDKLRRSFACWD